MVDPGLRQLRRDLPGRRVEAVGRRAKWIVWQLAPAGRLMLHLRMSGHPEVLPEGTTPAKHVHFVLAFDDGRAMHLDDARKFARVLWSPADDPLADLGMEPLSEAFTVEWLTRAMRRRSRRLKPALLDQAFIAGLGNIYTDEALHRARLHPLRATDSLRRPEIERLRAAIRESLETGIRHNGASIDWVYPGGEMQDYFRAYGRTGSPCPECGTPIRRMVVGQRGTHFCPACQRAPRAEASRPARRTGRG